MTSCANVSPPPELSLTPATVPSAASAAIVSGSTVTLTVLGMLYTHSGWAQRSAMAWKWSISSSWVLL